MSGKLCTRISNPPHPGEIIRDTILKKNGLSIKDAAILLRVERAALSAVTCGKQRLTPHLCYRLAVVFEDSAKRIADLQTDYDLKKAEEKLKKLNLKPYSKNL